MQADARVVGRASRAAAVPVQQHHPCPPLTAAGACGHIKDDAGDGTEPAAHGQQAARQGGGIGSASGGAHFVHAVVADDDARQLSSGREAGTGGRGYRRGSARRGGCCHNKLKSAAGVKAGRQDLIGR